MRNRGLEIGRTLGCFTTVETTKMTIMASLSVLLVIKAPYSSNSVTEKTKRLLLQNMYFQFQLILRKTRNIIFSYLNFLIPRHLLTTQFQENIRVY